MLQTPMLAYLLEQETNVLAGLFTGVRDLRFDFSLLLPAYFARESSKASGEP